TDSGVFAAQRVRGTLASPAPVNVGDRIGEFAFIAETTTPAAVVCAALECFAATVGSTSVEGEVRLTISPSTSTTRVTRARANITGFFANLAAADPGAGSINNGEVVFYNVGTQIWCRYKDSTGTNAGTVQLG